MKHKELPIADWMLHSGAEAVASGTKGKVGSIWSDPYLAPPFPEQVINFQ